MLRQCVKQIVVFMINCQNSQQYCCSIVNVWRILNACFFIVVCFTEYVNVWNTVQLLASVPFHVLIYIYKKVFWQNVKMYNYSQLVLQCNPLSCTLQYMTPVMVRIQALDLGYTRLLHANCCYQRHQIQEHLPYT